MKDNIKPEHYRTGEIDLYEAFSQIFPHNEYRAGMQMIAMRYMFRDKVDRVEDLDKAMETLERLKEKEIEYRDIQVKSKDEVMDDVNHEDLLRRLSYDGYLYLARDEDGALYAFNGSPVKTEESGLWDDCLNLDSEHIRNDNFPEVKWSDEEPTEIADLLDIYLKGGENGK